MNGGVRVDLVAGSSVLLPKGVRVVVSVNPTGVVVKDFSGDATTLLWADLQTARRVADGRVDAVALPVASLLAGLSKPARDAALDRLEVVQTILTGYANGHPALAREGEPFSAFDPKGGFSERARCLSMAALLESEAAINRRAQRAREDRERRPYESIGGTALRTIQAWVQAYNDPVNGGVLALIDGRSKKSHKDFASLDPELNRPGFRSVLQARMEPMNQKYSPEMRERALRMLDEAKPEHPNLMSAVRHVAGLLGMSPETLRVWHRRREIDAGQRPGVPTDVAEENKRLRRENAELKKANEVLKAASVFFAKELDRP